MSKTAFRLAPEGHVHNECSANTENVNPQALDPLSFRELRAKSVPRSAAAFGHALGDRTPTDWGCALAGEVGEACNLVHKLRRGEDVPIQEIAHELADVVIYADLLAARLGIDLGAAVREKFNLVSDRRGCAIKLPSAERQRLERVLVLEDLGVSVGERDPWDAAVIALRFVSRMLKASRGESIHAVVRRHLDSLHEAHRLVHELSSLLTFWPGDAEIPLLVSRLRTALEAASAPDVPVWEAT